MNSNIYYFTLIIIYDMYTCIYIDEDTKHKNKDTKICIYLI